MGKAQDMVRGVMEEQGLSFSPEVRMLDLVSETGELAKEWLKGTGYGQREFTHTPGLEEEVGDCLFSLLALCEALGMDADGALAAALEKYARRARETGSVGSGR